MIIGVISDTHGLLRPEVMTALRCVDHILHAGDVGAPEILTKLRTIAPLTAIRGNIDLHGDCARLPATEALELGGCLFYMIHSVRDLDINPLAAKVDMVVSGHSHRPDLQNVEGVFYLNPGSCGPRRFDLPISFALLEVAAGTLHPRIVELHI